MLKVNRNGSYADIETLRVGDEPIKALHVKQGMAYYEIYSYNNWPTEYFIKFLSDSSFTLSCTPHWDGTVEYSYDKVNWATWDGSAISGKRICLRGIGNTRFATDTSNRTIFTMTRSGSDNIRCYGNIETLLDYSTVANGNHPTMGDYGFNGLFKNCEYLSRAPQLPATTLSQYCYFQMFYGCFALTKPLDLPATTLVDGCYSNMFFQCTGIKLSETQTGEYIHPYRVPMSGEGTTATWALTNMFILTGGTFTGTPTINTTYYLAI